MPKHSSHGLGAASLSMLLLWGCGRPETQHRNLRGSSPSSSQQQDSQAKAETVEPGTGIESLDPQRQVDYLQERLNELRLQAGLGPVVKDETLAAYSLRASEDIAAGRPVHELLNQMNRDEKIAAGFCHGGSENQVPGWPMKSYQQTLDEILVAMMSGVPDGSHRDNILDPTATRLGIGFVTRDNKLYLTISFSQTCP